LIQFPSILNCLQSIYKSELKNKINIIDLFSGPGGLGEGFSSYKYKGAYKYNIILSAEKDPFAHETLKLRAFYRQFRTKQVPEEYYDYIRNPNTTSKKYLFEKYKKEYKNSISETFPEPKELGSKKDDKLIIDKIKNNNKSNSTIVIGGPPCQAYSLAGRSRNAGIEDYTIESDGRAILYKEYLKILDVAQPEVFVMENVKGFLSAKYNKKLIFPKILRDLHNPSKAINKKSGADYKIYSLVSAPDNYDKNGNPIYEKNSSFIIKMENYGIPQKRHRVILLGIRSDIDKKPEILNPFIQSYTVKQVINGLPKLRSGLSKELDNSENWINSIKTSGTSLIKNIESKKQEKIINNIIKELREDMIRGGNFVRATNMGFTRGFNNTLSKWLFDPKLKGFPNHETRGHIKEDLQRYLWASTYCVAQHEKERCSPKAKDYPCFLAPDHANWESGYHADRFRVQISNKPATTITSHISKDGHYYIHYDPLQCRSLTVREAARIQTFPDNYFFEGPRTSQYTQVGNAVPPFLANQIAGIIFNLLRSI
jgi:DNA (cytosine-5)-methyltransferase 1